MKALKFHRRNLLLLAALSSPFFLLQENNPHMLANASPVKNHRVSEELIPCLQDQEIPSKELKVICRKYQVSASRGNSR